MQTPGSNPSNISIKGPQFNSNVAERPSCVPAVFDLYSDDNDDDVNDDDRGPQP